jgi:RPA family protein
MRMLLAAILLSAAAWAHHGWSGYDNSKDVTLTGVVREATWANPHGTLRVQVDGGKGKIWTTTLAPVARMEQRGMSADSVKVGTTVTVIGKPSRTRADEIKAERIVINGKSTELRR